MASVWKHARGGWYLEIAMPVGPARKIYLGKIPSSAAQSVRLLLELPAGVRLVEATGPTRWGADQALVAFAQVSQLKPGTRAVYTVTVVGEKPGALRLKAQVTATDLEPLEDEETTRFYSDR